MKFSKSRQAILLGMAIVLGAFLRFYRLEELLVLTGDVGRDLLAARDIVLKQKFPLFGPPTSLGWFHLGPLTYYLWALALFIGRFHPLSVAVLVVFFDLLAILLVFFLAKRLYGQKTAILVSFLYAASPYVLYFSRLPLHLSLTPFFSLLFLGLCHSFLKEEKPQYFFLACVILGVLIQVHLTTLILASLFGIMVYRRVNIRQALIGSLLFLLPLLPFLIADASQGLVMSSRLFLWLPYRFLSAFGILARKNLLTLSRFMSALNLILEVARKLIFISQREVAGVIFLVSAVFLLQGRKDKLPLVIVGFSLLVFLLHGQPAEHYFIFLAPLVLLIVATFLAVRKEGLILAMILIVTNIVVILRESYFVNLSFRDQTAIVEYIIGDAEGKSYQISPPPDIVGLPDYYQHYRYLGWWLGNEPVDTGGEARYMIYERKTNIVSLKPGEELIEFPRAIIVKSK